VNKYTGVPSENWTPLFHAIYAGDLSAVISMLNANPSLINHRDRLGDNAISLAAGYGYKHIVEWFLSN